MKKEYVASGFVLGVVLAAIYFVILCCGGGPKPQTSQPAPPVDPVILEACADGSPAGTKRDQTCPAGQTGIWTQVCAAASWQDAVKTCTARPPTTPPTTPPTPGSCSVLVYADVQPILQDKCVPCHAPLAAFSTLTTFAQPSEIARRVGLDIKDPDHMPLATRPQLDPADITKIQTWVAKGANGACPDHTGQPTTPPAVGTISTAAAVQAAAQDALQLSPTDQPFQRYAFTTGAINDGKTGEALQAFADALQKGINSVNVSGSDLVPATKVTTGVWRVDLRSYGIDAAGIAAVDGATQLGIIDQTSEGQILRSLVKDDHAWWQVDDLLNAMLNTPGVYYKLTKVPTTLAQYQKQIGVNFDKDLAALPNLPGTKTAQVSFIGAVGQITIGKNRLAVRDSVATSQGGSQYYWQTFDVNAQPDNVLVNGIVEDQKNLTQFPLLPGTGANDPNSQTASVNNFSFDASETIIQLPNGMQGYALFDKNGKRLNAADPAIVLDTTAASEGLSEIISVGQTCAECHNHGVNALADTTLQAVTGNSGNGQLSGNDLQLVKAAYHSAATNNATFAADMAAYDGKLQQLGIKPGADPISVVGNRFQRPWTGSQLAGELGLSYPDFQACLSSSAGAKAAIGQLASSPTATAAATTIFGVLQQLYADCNLFRNPVAQ